MATEPNEATRRWWAHTSALADDAMEGRDTGSAGCARETDTLATLKRALSVSRYLTDVEEPPNVLQYTMIAAAIGRPCPHNNDTL